MRVLHDWDDPYLKWRYAAWLGLRYLVYAFFCFFRVHPKFLESVNDELRVYAETLAKLDKLCGVESVYGVRDVVKSVYPDIGETLAGYDGVDVRRHIHIGEDYKDPNRRRLWEPPLDQPPHTWHYDRDYVKGFPPSLTVGELPIWHVDRPHFLKHYIDFLYRVKILGEAL